MKAFPEKYLVEVWLFQWVFFPSSSYSLHKITLLVKSMLWLSFSDHSANLKKGSFGLKLANIQSFFKPGLKSYRVLNKWDVSLTLFLFFFFCLFRMRTYGLWKPPLMVSVGTFLSPIFPMRIEWRSCHWRPFILFTLRLFETHPKLCVSVMGLRDHVISRPVWGY